MTYNIDLKELSQRESEKVEWKEHGDDKYIVVSYVRIGRETRIAKNGIFRQLMESK